ncbi:ATP-binding protein [Polyangium aurulentum]|uniref:ATP-binding protein n=1 Tax=Polyangium aurulentum TaxID=2567896 RepID=UPI0010ADE0F9|nr:ATP-binding protein [Polyangium aurulentum]UQA63407.1 ATP-binding protein [Polyangium aurulentum]
MRTFTAEGPCDPLRHHHLPAAPRLPEARGLIDEGSYFLLRSPRRTGKTTTLLALAAELSREGRYAALCVPCAVGETSSDATRAQVAEEALLASLRLAAEHDLPPALRPPVFPSSAEGTRILTALDAWARACPRPIVLFLDDIDALRGPSLRSVLGQLAAGFSRRPAAFPWSVALSSEIDLRDERLGGGELSRAGLPGPFDIAVSTEAMRRFTEDETRALYAQHAAETGQRFDEPALRAALVATAGHPFLVQALGREIARGVEPPAPVTADHVEEAAARLVQKGVTPIDNLAALLADERVRRVIEPLLAGRVDVAAARAEDVDHARDIGLLAPDAPARIEGGIHRALVPRLLASGVERVVSDDPAQLFGGEGRLDMALLLDRFAAFYAAHGEALSRATAYEAIAPELVLLGYLHRALHGRGRVVCDYGVGRGRVDVLLSIPLGDAPAQREALVLVSRRKGERGAKKRGLGWLEVALDRLQLQEGTLVLFDRRKSAPRHSRIRMRQLRTAKGRIARFLRA